MRLNTPNRSRGNFTHGGGSGFGHTTKLQELKRSVSACLLWENEFYEDGASIAQRIHDLAREVDPTDLAELAVNARHGLKLRHAPLMLLVALTTTGAGRGDGLVARTIERVISRPDELTEFMAIYKAMGGRTLSKQAKVGLGEAFKQFDEYQLAKYNRDGAWKLRDVLFLTHPKPRDDDQQALWNRLVDGTLATPDTWETNLSAGEDKKATFTRLLEEGKLGYLALLRNLRNMDEAGVNRALIRGALTENVAARARRVLPFRFVAAARAAPTFANDLNTALLQVLAEMEPLSGLTAVLVDCSGSMASRLSGKSDLSRMDAAATLAAILPGDKRIFSFANTVREVPNIDGLPMIEAIIRSNSGGTALAESVESINRNVPYDRLIVITDEQSTSWRPVPGPKGKGYMINVASYQNGVGYGPWTHIDGFSENVLRFIQEFER